MIRRGRGINVNEIMYYNQDDMIRSKYKQEVCIDDKMLYSLILPYKERNELIKTRMIVAFCVSLSLVFPSLSITILNALFNGIDDDFWFMMKFSLITAFLIFAFISLILWRPKRWDERKIMKKKQKIQDKLNTIHIYKAKMIAPTTPTDVRLNLITEILIINRQDKEFSKVFDTVYINFQRKQQKTLQISSA